LDIGADIKKGPALLGADLVGAGFELREFRDPDASSRPLSSPSKDFAQEKSVPVRTEIRRPVFATSAARMDSF
jgi:hypothetical protein